MSFFASMVASISPSETIEMDFGEHFFDQRLRRRRVRRGLHEHERAVLQGVCRRSSRKPPWPFVSGFIAHGFLGLGGGLVAAGWTCLRNAAVSRATRRKFGGHSRERSGAGVCAITLTVSECDRVGCRERVSLTIGLDFFDGSALRRLFETESAYERECETNTVFVCLRYQKARRRSKFRNGLKLFIFRLGRPIAHTSAHLLTTHQQEWSRPTS